MNYKFSVSGYRGIWGESLNREIGRRLANSFARYTRAKTIAIGRDSRPSSFPLREAVMEGLNIGGVSTLDMGLLPTPTSCVNAKNLRIPAIMITASHNILSPEHWNGLKFIGRSGLFLNEREIEKLKAIYAGVQESGLIKVDAPVKNEVYPDPFDLHLSLILNNVNVDLIRSRNFLVALDSVNGAGSFITKILLERLGCRVTSINTDPEMVLKTNDFPHGPEPTPSHITDLCELVKAKRADVGFAQDPDADRLMSGVFSYRSL